MMHGRGKSDFAIVAVKPANKAEQSAAELVEQRAETKGNANQQSACRTQSRVSVSQALERIRQAFAVMTRGKSRMRESCMYGSARGAPSNGRPYRDRRDFITLLGGAAVAWPLAAHAQQQRLPVIGFVNSSSPHLYVPFIRAWQQGLGETGYAEGRNVAVEYRWAMGHYDRLPALVTELAGLPVAVLAATSGPAALAAKAANTTVPIVFTMAADPVELGLVASLARPGANITGVTQMTTEVGPKRLELMHELLPAAATVALLVNPNNSVIAETEQRNLRATACTLGRQLIVLNAGSEHDLDKVFASLVELRAGGLLISTDPFFFGQSARLADLAQRHAMPTLSVDREFVAAGGLISYGGDVAHSYRLAGVYTGRILKGDKPADLPVQQSTKVELHINLKTAKALGLTVPLPLLGRADGVIE